MGDARLLLVDDEASITFAMREYFELAGYCVDHAADAPQARQLLASAAYAVVIADLRLGVDSADEGLELAAEVRREHPTTRIVLLTAYGSPEIEARAHALGIDAFLHKPQPLAEIAAIVQRLAGRAG